MADIQGQLDELDRAALRVLELTAVLRAELGMDPSGLAITRAVSQGSALDVMSVEGPGAMQDQLPERPDTTGEPLGFPSHLDEGEG